MLQNEFYKFYFDEKVAPIIKDVVPPSEKKYIMFLELVFLDMLRKFDLNDINNSAINVLCNADVKYQEWLKIYPKYNTDVYDKYLQIIYKRVNANTFNDPKATTSQKLQVINILDEIYTDFSYINPELEQSNLFKNEIKYLQKKKVILLDKPQYSVTIIPEKIDKPNYCFDWMNADIKYLDRISEQLYNESFTNNKEDFKKAIIDNKEKILWKKEPAFLVILINYLCIEKKPQILSVTPIYNAYIEACKNSFFDKNCELAKSSFYYGIIDRINNKNIRKHIRTKEYIVKMVENILSSK